MAKVVKLEIDNGKMRCAADVVNLIRLESYGIPARELAEACNVSRSCIYAIRAGRTKWPRGETLFSILTELGYEVHIRKMRNS